MTKIGLLILLGIAALWYFGWRFHWDALPQYLSGESKASYNKQLITRERPMTFLSWRKN